MSSDGYGVFKMYVTCRCMYVYCVRRLHVRENSRGKVCIAGLMETEVTSVKGLVEVR